jgi:hypothetical protein
MVSFIPRQLYPRGKILRYPLDRSLDGPQFRSGRGGEGKNIPSFLPSLLLSGRECCPARSIVTMLPRLIVVVSVVMVMILVMVVVVKVKLSLCLTKHHPMKKYWGSGGIAPRIIDHGTRWR